jgi:hypothetical protein
MLGSSMTTFRNNPASCLTIRFKPTLLSTQYPAETSIAHEHRSAA